MLLIGSSIDLRAKVARMTNDLIDFRLSCKQIPRRQCLVAQAMSLVDLLTYRVKRDRCLPELCGHFVAIRTDQLVKAYLGLRKRSCGSIELV